MSGAWSQRGAVPPWLGRNAPDAPGRDRVSPPRTPAGQTATQAGFGVLSGKVTGGSMATARSGESMAAADDGARAGPVFRAAFSWGFPYAAAPYDHRSDSDCAFTHG
jgi:hypothetical protein